VARAYGQEDNKEEKKRNVTIPSSDSYPQFTVLSPKSSRTPPSPDGSYEARMFASGPRSRHMYSSTAGELAGDAIHEAEIAGVCGETF
jgi:hypothetical protein